MDPILFEESTQKTYLPFGNQTWQLKVSYKWRFWWENHVHTAMFDYRREGPKIIQSYSIASSYSCIQVSARASSYFDPRAQAREDLAFGSSGELYPMLSKSNGPKWIWAKLWCATCRFLACSALKMITVVRGERTNCVNVTGDHCKVNIMKPPNLFMYRLYRQNVQ